MAPPMRKNYLFDPADFEPEGEDAFPHFHDADVRIIINGSRQYYLHQNVLVRMSPVLAELLSEERGAELSSKAIQKGVIVRWRLDAVAPSNRDKDEHDVSLILRPIALDERGKSMLKIPVPLSLENGMVVDPVLPAYDSIFRAFYGMPIDANWADAEDLEDIIAKIGHIHQVAGYLKTVHIVAKPIEALLLATGQRLYQSIYNNPPGWLNFSTSIQSKPIFKEALIHAVGQYNTPLMKGAMQEATEITPEIREVVELKAQLLLEQVKTAVMKMLSYYPQHMQRQDTLGSRDVSKIGRDSYASDIMSWIALTAFRHWLSQSVADDQTHHAQDMGYAFLELVAKGNEAYLDGEAMGEFHRFIPMTEKGESIVGNKLLDMKKHIKDFVGHLLDNYAALDGTGRTFFTCTIVDYTDYPWTNRKRPADFDDEDEDEEEDAAAEEEEADWEQWEGPVDGAPGPSGTGMIAPP